jgi:DNA polymerase
MTIEVAKIALYTAQRIASTCTECALWEGRNKPVFARGDSKSPIIVCGMCPGPDENKAGIPFVGNAGQILDTILVEVFGDNDSVYITNLVKCFVKPGTPLEHTWMRACLMYLIAQIGLIKPKVVIALGKDVCNYLLNNSDEMRDLRGNTYPYMGTNLICTYHPSYLARGGGVKHRHYGRVVDDFKKAFQYI